MYPQGVYPDAAPPTRSHGESFPFFIQCVFIDDLLYARHCWVLGRHLGTNPRWLPKQGEVIKRVCLGRRNSPHISILDKVARVGLMEKVVFD